MSDNYTIGDASNTISTGHIDDGWITIIGDTACVPVNIPSVWAENNKKGDDDMRYLYEVILVNPKNDAFSEVRIVAKSETSALMKAYDATQFKNKINKTLIGNLEGVEFDDLKTSCRILMEWKKEKSLKKAIETIKEAVE